MTENQLNIDKKPNHDTRSYCRTKMQKEKIIEKLRERGCRITKQRLIILDIILENECSCCKEIFFKALKIDDKIGTATIYRMINTLEEIGAISRKNMYKVAYSDKCMMENTCTILLDDGTIYNLSAQKWNTVIKEGLLKCGYLKKQNIQSVTLNECECEKGSC